MERSRALARLALVAVTLFWGSTFVVIHSGLELLSPLVLVAARFATAAVTVKLLFRRARFVTAAIPLALANGCGYALQTFGLETTLPSRSAFLTALSVILVPLLYPLFGRRLPRPRVRAAAGLALIGVYALCRPLGSAWTQGDSLTVLSAVTFAYYVVELGRLSRQHPVSHLVFTQCAFTAVVATAVATLTGGARFELHWEAVATVLYLGLVCTAVTFGLMAWAQARVEPTEAAILYTLEPVLAAGISVAIGRENLTAGLVAGGSLILMATFVAGGPDEPG